MRENREPAMISSTEPRVQFEMKPLTMDTSNVYEVSVGPLAGPKGQTMGMVVVCRDVTERRKALSQLRAVMVGSI